MPSSSSVYKFSLSLVVDQSPLFLSLNETLYQTPLGLMHFTSMKSFHFDLGVFEPSFWYSFLTLMSFVRILSSNTLIMCLLLILLSQFCCAVYKLLLLNRKLIVCRLNIDSDNLQMLLLLYIVKEIWATYIKDNRAFLFCSSSYDTTVHIKFRFIHDDNLFQA